MQAIQAGDLFHQVLELGEQGWADVARLNEINRQRDPKLLEIARTLNLEGRTPGENAREALAVMQAGGNVVERERHDEMVSAAGAKYLAESRRPSCDHDKAAAGEKQSVLLITTTNADRKEMNFEIRKARIAAGEIEEGPKFQVLSPAPQGITAGEYRKGEEIVFTGYRGDDGRMQRWGARLNTVGKVTGIDLEKNRVAVTYSFTARNKKGQDVFKTVTKKLPAAEMAGKTTVFREEERNFAPGDRIIALRNNRDLGVQNGSLGVIKNLAADGQVLVDFGSREINLDLKLYKHVDHAYAVTIPKSQGATVEHSILFARVQPGEGKIKAVDGVSAPGDECYGRVSYNALNVAITRAQYGGCVFTNSIIDLLREVEHEDRKTSTLNQIPGGPEKSIPLGIEKSAAEKSPDLGVPMNRESKDRTGQERHVNRAEKELPAGGMNHEGFDPGKDRGKDRVSRPAAGEKNRGIDRGKFDRGAKLGAHLDRLALAGKSMRGYQDDLLPKLGPEMPSLGKEIAKQVVQVAVPGIEMELKK